MKLFTTPGCRPGWTRAAVHCASILLTACTTTGIGSGTAGPQGSPVNFEWTSQDGGMSGTMTAKLNNGAIYTGPFMQVTSAANTDLLESIWYGWDRGWVDWDDAPNIAFVPRYSGRVVANLAGQGGARMRCRFRLNSPPYGMSGGGQGECQFAGGKTVDATFPPS